MNSEEFEELIKIYVHDAKETKMLRRKFRNGTFFNKENQNLIDDLFEFSNQWLNHLNPFTDPFNEPYTCVDKKGYFQSFISLMVNIMNFMYKVFFSISFCIFSFKFSF